MFEIVADAFYLVIWLSETTRQLYAKDVTKRMDLSKYDGIVCVSGDGVLAEVSFISG